MSELTPLDAAHAAMQAAPEDDAARMRFYQRLADSELFVLLRREAQGDAIEPEVFELSDIACVLVFDREERLADFVGKPAPYAALSGRALVAMLAGQWIGMAVNPEGAPSSILLPVEAVEWLAQTLAPGPEEMAGRARAVRPPAGLPEGLVAAIDAKLAQAGGLARAAYLVGITYENGQSGHLLGLVGTVPGAEGALAKSVGEAVIFAGGAQAALDVGFFADAAPVLAQMQAVGLRFDLPERRPEQPPERPAPGSDPARPPILK